MKTYKFEVVINEQNDEWWEEITKDNKSGCDEILDYLDLILGSSNLSYNLKFIDHQDK